MGVKKEEWKSFREEAKIVEKEFAKNLENPIQASNNQNFLEHWDVQGTLNGKLSKFEVKDLIVKIQNHRTKWLV